MSTATATPPVAEAFAVLARAQPGVVRALSEAVATDTVAHAWLLLGPRGAGQLEAARFLGAALNCERSESVAAGSPCGSCPSCRRVIAGQHVAVRDFVPEGVEHRVGQVRDEWIPTATRTTLDGRAKVLRIVAADRMNEIAQNAFLKVLEEPPPSTYWILDANDEAAMLETISSRCRRLDLTSWKAQDLSLQLDAWVTLGDGDPGVGSGREVLDGKREHLDTPTTREREALVRLSRGSPELLADLATCDARLMRARAVELVGRLLELGPRAAGGNVPMLVNEVLDDAAAAVDRLKDTQAVEFAELERSLGLVTAEGRPVKGASWPTGLKPRETKRHERAQREANQHAVRRYLELLAAAMRDVLACSSGAGPEALSNVDRADDLRRAGERVKPASLVGALASIESAHEMLDLNGQPRLQLERVLVQIVLALFAS